jgi:hypothetical protein
MKVAVIGNGVSILEKKKGAEIDTYDIVIRQNLFYLKMAPETTGLKTNIWSCCFNTNYQYDDEDRSSEIWCARPKAWDTANDAKWRIPDKVKPKVMKEITDGEYDACHQAIKPYGGSNPTTGFITLFMAMREFPNYEKHLYGYDFYEPKWCYYESNTTYDPTRDHRPDGEKKCVQEWAKQGKVVLH